MELAKKTPHTPRLFFWLPLIVGILLVLLSVGFHFAWQSEQSRLTPLLEHGEKGKGRIAAIESILRNERAGRRDYYGKIIFRCGERDAQRLFKWTEADTGLRPALDTPVQVLYNPEKPDDFILANLPMDTELFPETGKSRQEVVLYGLDRRWAIVFFFVGLLLMIVPTALSWRKKEGD